MKLVSIEPTPNPNDMKINLDESLDSGVKYTVTQQDKGNYPDYVERILSVPGVIGIFQVNDFMSIKRQPNAEWEKILIAVRRVLEGDELTKTRASEEQQESIDNFGEVRVFLQMFRRIPMLVKVSDKNDEKRLAIPPKFQDAVTKTSKASKNMLIERQWKALDIRYGTLEQVGEAVVEEIDAAYDDKRLALLVDGAFQYEPDKSEKKRLNDNELNEHLASDDWRNRFTALQQMDADPEHFDLFVKMTKDKKMNIRRLAVIYLGLIKDARVLEPLCEGLKDESVAVRRTAGDALTDLGDVRAINPILETLNDNNKLVRWRAARFLFEHGDASSFDALHKAKDDPEFEVRMQIRQAIERIESGGEALGNVWQQMTRKSGEED